MLAEPKGFRRSPLLEDPKTRYFVITSNVGDHVVKSVQHSVWATQRKNEQKLNDAYRSSTAVILVFSVNRSGAFQGYARMRSMTGRATCRSDPFSGFGRLFNVEWLRLHDIDVTEVNHLRNPLDDSRQVGFSRDGQELAHDVGAELCRHFDLQIFREDPASYEPVVDALPRLELPPASSPPQQQQPLLALLAPGGIPPPQGPAEASPTAAAAPGGCCAVPLGGPLQPSGPLQPTGPLHPGGPMRPPFAPPGPYGHPVGSPMHYPPGYGYHPYGPPPWAAPPPLLVGGDPRHGRHRGRRRRRSSSYSSYYSEASAPKKSHKKKKEKKKKDKSDKKRKREGSRREKPPDFEKMSYEEYMEWWRKTHTPGLPAPASIGPAPAPTAAQAPAPAAAAAVPGAPVATTGGDSPAEAPEEGPVGRKARGNAIPPPASLKPQRAAARTGSEGAAPPGVWAEGGAGRAGEERAASSTPSAASDLPEGEVAGGTSPVPEGVYQ